MKLHVITTALKDLDQDVTSVHANSISPDLAELLCDSLNVPVKWEMSTKREVKRSRKDQPTSRPRAMPDAAVSPLDSRHLPDESKALQEKLDLASLERMKELSERPTESSSVLMDAEEKAINRMEMEYPLRPPVVSIMGHVDHGKTTLLDYIRVGMDREEDKEKKGKKKKKSSSKKKKKQDAGKSASAVAGTEAGGITQAVSSFLVSSQLGKICFLDTPGHAAFKSMRVNGAKSVDVVVLVVASDDGVNEQTKEVIETALRGGQAIVVAMTKIDKPGVDREEALTRISNELASFGVMTEGLGGETQMCPVSGITGEGVPELMDALVLQAEVMELRADPDAQGEGVVVDAMVDKGLGVVADVVVRWGKVKVGDAVVAGVESGRVKAMKCPAGRPLKEAGPSTPIRIVGLRGLPRAGDEINIASCEKIAKEVADKRAEDMKIQRLERAAPQRMELELTGGAARTKSRIDAANVAMLRGEKLAREFKRRFIPELSSDDKRVLREGETERPRASVVVKADCDGSLDAIVASIQALGEETKVDIDVDIISASVGAVSESDVKLADDAQGCIMAFNVGFSGREAKAMGEEKGVPINTSNIIYSLLDEAKVTLGRYAPANLEDKSLGTLAVAKIFELGGSHKQRGGVEVVAGCKVISGNVSLKNCQRTGLETYFRVMRSGKEVHRGRGRTLRKFKDIVAHVEKGDECGLSLEGFTDLQEGDAIECTVEETVYQVL